jgi:hypothetical protein
LNCKKWFQIEKLPIVNTVKGVKECITCCDFSKEYLAQCRHYLILTNFDYTSFSCRIITSTSKYGNHQLNEDDYVLEGYLLFSGKPLKYYSSTTYTIENSCIDLTKYAGYIKKHKFIF